MNVDRLAWLDIETTGLDPERDDILELGIVITDSKLVELARASWVLGDARDPADIRDPEVRKMHEESGLIDELYSSGCEIGQVQNEALTFIRAHGAEQSPMCGASVHFDRSFIRAGMPELFAAFHYRNFDVSTFKVWAALLGVELPQKRGVHRVLPDLEDAIALGRWGLARFNVGCLHVRVEELREKAAAAEAALLRLLEGA